MNFFPLLSAAVLAIATIGCTSAPFSYSQDRCLGEHNQCQNACLDIDNGSARSACIERCYDNESRCYASGASGEGSSLATDEAIGAARTQAEKEAAFERWKAQKERERAAAEEEEGSQ